MIVEWLFSLGAGLGEWVLSWLTFDIPDWFDTFTGIFAQIFASAVGLGAWVPWEVLTTMLATVFSLYGIILLIKAVRWLVGWIPTMGGS